MPWWLWVLLMVSVAVLIGAVYSRWYGRRHPRDADDERLARLASAEAERHKWDFTSGGT